MDIPRPDLMKNTPLRISPVNMPVNMPGIAVLSTIELVDKTTNKRVALIQAGNDRGFVTLGGSAVTMPAKDSLVILATGKTAEFILSNAGPLPDHPMRADIRIRVTDDLAVYNETLRAFLSRESWKAILGTDHREKDPDSLLHLADAFEKAGCLTEADAVLQKGLEMHLASESLRVAFAELAMNRQSWAEAIRRWQDVAAFMGQHTQAYIYQQLNEAYRNQQLFPLGSPEEEAHMGDGDKHEILSLIHQVIAPELYLEIGVQKGKSLALAQCPAIGIDPMPIVEIPLSEKAQIVTMSSDNFFKGPAVDSLRQAPDLVFIDGMHFFEYALRDFMNVERFAAPWTLVVIDDIFPAHPAQAERQRRTRTWTGDVWKLYAVLKKYRSDLFFLPVNTSPTGLMLIAGLKSGNRVLLENYDAIVERYAADMVPPGDILTREGVFTSKHIIIPAVLEVLRNARKLRLSAEEITADLEEKVKQVGS